MSRTQYNEMEVDLLAKMAIATSYNTYSPVGPVIFNTAVPDRLNEKEVVTAMDGRIPESEEGSAYEEVISTEIGSKTFTTKEYKVKSGITRLMMQFQNFGTTLTNMRSIGYNARYKQDDLMAQVLAKGFDTTTTFDGAYLFSASHKVGIGAAVQSNLISGALSKAKIMEAYTKLGQMKDHKGLIMPLPGAKLVIPRALYSTAYEAINSAVGPDTNNNKNVLNSLGIEIVVWPLLDAYSTTAWFMVAPKEFTTLRAYQKTQPSVTSYVDNATDNLYEKVYMSQTQGAADYVGVCGSTGA